MRSALLLVLAASAPAAADPCGDRANDVVARYPNYVTYCEACGDRAPSEPAIAIRGRALELAHTYVATSAVRYENLAALAGCPVVGVPPSLRVSDETEHGVLITPDWVPVRPAAAPPPAPEPLVVAAPQIIFVPVDEGPPWALLGGIVGLATGATGVLFAIALPRRRRSSLPRALDLVDR